MLLSKTNWHLFPCILLLRSTSDQMNWLKLRLRLQSNKKFYDLKELRVSA